MILLLDNYDSFTYNIAQYAGEFGADLRVVRNDAISVHDAMAMEPQGIILSPGPCTPDKAGISEDLIRAAAGKVTVFGVCLGMQAIGEVFGAKVVPAQRIMHGKESVVSHDGLGVFRGIPSPFKVIRYHSLALASIPEELTITATSEDGEVMGVRHREHAIEGVQFHPESVLTEHGKQLVGNWLSGLSTH
ncbi:MAG: aminodeoxychorismate/anthranilate synthase component II [Armatimonadota bacterium]|nr:aminodeoxychorismate/anthranilate synthase component II [Armatimonadota bacterium]